MFIVLMALGLMSFSKLPVTRFPNIDVPIVSVTVTDPGVAPSELETQVTKRIEDAVANISGVKNVTSTITEGHVADHHRVPSRGRHPDRRQRRQGRHRAHPLRPSGDLEEPVVNRVDVEGQAILTYAVSAPAMTIEELSWFVDDTVIRKLQGLKGVARVDRYGGVDPRDQGRARPRPAERARRHGRRRQPALRAANVDLDRRQRRFRRPRPGDPHARRRQELADLEKLEIPLRSGRTRHAVRDRHGHRYLGEAEILRPRQQPDRRRPSASSAARARATSTSTAASRRRSPSCRPQHPDVTISKVDNSVHYTEATTIPPWRR